MDGSPFGQTFELGIFISAAEKSTYFCIIRGKCNHVAKTNYTFPRIITKVYKIRKLHRAIFHILQYFATKPFYQI